jgi:hypothetical protein
MTALVPTICNRSSGADSAAGMVGNTAADTLPAGPDNYLRIKNTTGSPVTVTVLPAGVGASAQAEGPEGTSLAAYPLVPAVAATAGDMIYGPFPQMPWGDANGNVNLTYSAVAAGITVKALTITTT